MVFSFLYLALRALLGALVRSRRGLHVKDVELLVLRVGCIYSIFLQIDWIRQAG